jgi:hypothetical protein
MPAFLVLDPATEELRVPLLCFRGCEPFSKRGGMTPKVSAKCNAASCKGNPWYAAHKSNTFPCAAQLGLKQWKMLRCRSTENVRPRSFRDLCSGQGPRSWGAEPALFRNRCSTPRCCRAGEHVPEHIARIGGQPGSQGGAPLLDQILTVLVLPKPHPGCVAASDLLAEFGKDIVEGIGMPHDSS